MGRVSKEKISAIPHNMENYLTLDIGNQRYMDSLQLMPGSLDSHISNLGAEPCKEEVDKDGNSLNSPCKKPGHLQKKKNSFSFFTHKLNPAAKRQKTSKSFSFLHNKKQNKTTLSWTKENQKTRQLY